MEGRRQQQLRKALQVALDRSLDMKPRDFLQFFPPELAASHAHTLEDYCQQVTGKLRANIEEEFETICTEHDMARRLKRLDALFEQQREFADGSRVPPLTGMTPSDQAHDARVDAALAERERLLEALRAAEEENAKLKSEIAPKRVRAREICASVREAAEQCRAAAEHLPA